MSSDLIVVKLGGSILRDGEAIRSAAEKLKQEINKGNQIVAVVSAIQGMTDHLLSLSKEISPDIPASVLDQIIRLGEEQSVRLLTASLQLIGVDAVEITPESPSWPIITNEVYGDAEPLMDQCRDAVMLGIKPLVERGKLPVVSGFIGRSISGNITTLGRGGTDTTATILANCLDADQLVLVKDVGGVYTADPKIVGEANFIDFLSADEATVMTALGSKVLQDKVFNYKPDKLDIRIVSESKPFSSGGTVIYGKVEDLVLSLNDEPVSKLTIIGQNNIISGVFPRLWGILEELRVKIFSFNRSEKSISLIIEGDITGAIKKVHSSFGEKLTAVTIIENLILVKIHGTRLKSRKNAILRRISELDYIQIDSDDTLMMLLIPDAKKEKSLLFLKELLNSIKTQL